LKCMRTKIPAFTLFPLVTFTNLLLLSSILDSHPAIAQEELCRDIGEVAPSETLRTLEIPRFGINIDIPENYRTLALNNGSVQILDPGSFELVSCLARGGETPFARGMSSFTIHLDNNPRNLSLLRLAQQDGLYDGNSYRYNLSGTEVVIAESGGGYSVGAWFTPPRIDGVVVMEVSCDCEVDRNDIVFELDRIRLR